MLSTNLPKTVAELSVNGERNKSSDSEDSWEATERAFEEHSRSLRQTSINDELLSTNLLGKRSRSPVSAMDTKSPMAKKSLFSTQSMGAAGVAPTMTELSATVNGERNLVLASSTSAFAKVDPTKALESPSSPPSNVSSPKTVQTSSLGVVGEPNSSSLNSSTMLGDSTNLDYAHELKKCRHAIEQLKKILKIAFDAMVVRDNNYAKLKMQLKSFLAMESGADAAVLESTLLYQSSHKP